MSQLLQPAARAHPLAILVHRQPASAVVTHTALQHQLLLSSGQSHDCGRSQDGNCHVHVPQATKRQHHLQRLLPAVGGPCTRHPAVHQAAAKHTVCCAQLLEGSHQRPVYILQGAARRISRPASQPSQERAEAPESCAVGCWSSRCSMQEHCIIMTPFTTRQAPQRTTAAGGATAAA